VKDAAGEEDKPIKLEIRSSVLDLDGSEQISRLRIIGVPDGVELSVGVNNGDGSWDVPPSELDQLELNLPGFASEDFELTVEVTTEDGESSNTKTASISVEVQNNTLNSVISVAQQAEVDQQLEELQSQSGGQAEQPFTNPDSSYDFESAYNEIADLSKQVSDLSSGEIWNNAGFEAMNTAFEDIRESLSESPATQADVDTPSSSIEFESFEIPERNDLAIQEFEEFATDDLSEFVVSVDGFESEQVEIGTANMTVAALLLLCTKREDSRKKLRDFGKNKRQKKR
jgi:hypothetical protein